MNGARRHCPLCLVFSVQEGESADYRSIQRGWCLGNEEFRRELLAAAVERVGPNHYGSERRESGEQKAQRIVLEEMNRLGC